MRFRALFGAASAAFLLGTLLPGPASGQERVEAVWVTHSVNFVYQGFTTHYSCDGLRGKIREMLSKLGARDLQVRAFGCTRIGVEPFPGVRVTMQVLDPAPSEHEGKAAPLVPAHWQNVVLMAPVASLQEQGNCELIEQFKETFLPLFTTRHIDYRSNCVPHQLTLGTRLSAEVLMPDTAGTPGR